MDDDMKFIEDIPFPGNGALIVASQDPNPTQQQAVSNNQESKIGTNANEERSTKLRDVQANKNIHETLLSVLTASNNNALQTEFALEVSHQLEKFHFLRRNDNNKRKSPEVVDLVDTNSSDPAEKQNGNKRPRSTSDEFVSGILADHRADDMGMDYSREQQTNPGQDTSNEVQQQKDALIRWFSERLFQVETRLQEVIEEQSQAHEAGLQKLKQNHAEAIQRQLVELIEKSKAHVAEMETLKRLHAEELQKVRKPNNLPIDEIDLARLEKADEEYRVVRQGIGAVLMQQPNFNSDRVHLLREETVKYDRFKDSIKEELLLMRCRHLNERTVDKSAILELEGKYKSLQQKWKDATPLHEVGKLSARIHELEKQGRKQPPGTATTRQEWDSGVAGNIQAEAEVAKLQKAIHLQNTEMAILKQKLQDTARLRLEAVQQNERLLRQRLQDSARLQNNMQAAQQNSYMNALQQQVGLLQQTTTLSNNTLSEAKALKAQCDQSLREKDQAQLEEVRKLIKDHMGQTKGQRLRMEGLANKIKDLTSRNRDKSDTMHDMAEDINHLKAKIEAQRMTIEKLRNGASVS